jgi:hypothetical protein
MSKKDKSKFKKQLKAQILQDMQKFESQQNSVSVPKVQPAAPVAAQPKIVPSTNVAAAAVDSEINLPQIKYDLKKTAIVVAGMAVVIVILAILNNKQNVLINFGNTIFRVLHIGS